MAVKKTTKKADESAAPTKTEAKETAPKPKTKAAAPKAAAPKKAAPAEAKAAAPKKAAPAPVKLTPPQGELLKKIGSAGEAGYTAEKSVEERSIQLLIGKKLVRKGAKDKATGKVPYSLTVAGKKHIG